jgi:hypothetical protein
MADLSLERIESIRDVPEQAEAEEVAYLAQELLIVSAILELRNQMLRTSMQITKGLNQTNRDLEDRIKTAARRAIVSNVIWFTVAGTLLLAFLGEFG